MTWSILGQIVGGIGLFLVGIEFMRSGLKQAAGNSLRRILSDYTNTTIKGIFSGFLVSSAVQSASAVIITMIGFMNAHILGLRQAVTVVLGSNLGKITTAWIVTTVGLKLDLATYALPMLGTGIVSRAFVKKRYQGYCFALVGFSLLYMGIGVLKSSITEVTALVDLSQFATSSFLGNLAFLCWGIVMTVITQSSGAALAITLSATAAGLVTIENAASILIGLNFGTTSSAYFVSLRSNSNARRLAFCHIGFNVLCTLIGTLYLAAIFHTNLMSSFLRVLQYDPIVGLTLFYTTFIVSSILIISPFKDIYVNWLKRHFFETKSLGTPLFLKPHAKGENPVSASEASQLIQAEVTRFAKISLGMLRESLEWNTKNGWLYTVDLAKKSSDLDQLNEYIHSYASTYTSSQEASDTVEHIQMLCRAAQHFNLASNLSHAVTKFKGKLVRRLDNATSDQMASWSETLDEHVSKIKEVIKDGNLQDLTDIQNEIRVADEERRNIRHQFVESSLKGDIHSNQASALIDIIETARRAIREQIRGTYKLWSDHDTLKVLNLEFESQLFDLKKR